MLKERLNETERVIRNESDKITNISTSNIVGGQGNQHERGDFRKYHEEINDLKSMLFDEIRNLTYKERSPKVHENSSETNLRLLISQQEKEIVRLKNQLLERLTPDIENMHAKLQLQEDLWKSKLEHMEQQHRADIEKITSELKSTQEASELMKAKYESKVSILERRSEDQSTLLTSLSREINNAQVQTEAKKHSENHKDTETRSTANYKDISSSNSKFMNGIKENKLIIEDINSVSSDSTKNDLATVAPKIIKNSFTNTHEVTKNILNTIDKQFVDITNRDFDEVCEDSTSSKNSVPKVPQVKNETQRNRKMRFIKEQSKDQFVLNSPQTNNTSDSKTISIKSNVEEIDSKISKTHVSAIHEKNSKLLQTVSEMSSETLSSYSTEYETESESEILSFRKDENHPKCDINNIMILKETLLEKFEKKLKDLGIDPEWTGIPHASYEQKMKIIQHHQSIDVKKILRYNQIKKQIIEEVLQKVSMDDKAQHQSKLLKQSSLDKLITNANSKAVKTLNIPNISHDSSKKAHIKSESEISRDSDIQDIPQHKKRSLVVPNEIKQSDSNKTSPGILQHRDSLDCRKNLEEKSSNRLSMTPIKSYKSHRSKIKESVPSITDVGSIVEIERYTTSTPKEKTIISNFSKANKLSNYSVLQEGTDGPIISPKNNKSVLKSTSGSIGSLVKKKVFFDLTDQKERKSSSSFQSKELTDNDWSISGILDKKDEVLQKERSSSADNIVLKTNQAEKIAEISRKIEQQLSIPRRKPSGAIETMFSSAYVPKHNVEEENNGDTEFSDLNIIEHSIQHLPREIKGLNTNVSEEIWKDMKKSTELQNSSLINDDINLDTDIEDILRVE